MAGLGNGQSWITFRTSGDQLSNTYQLIGVVEEGKVKINDWVPLEVVEHLQASLDEAFKQYHECEKTVAELQQTEDPEDLGYQVSDNYRDMLQNGPLPFLPESHAQVFEDSDTVPGILGQPPKTFHYKYFVAQGRDQLRKLFASQRTAA
jgi:hypothetical protein